MKKVKSYNGLRFVFFILIFFTHLNFLDTIGGLASRVYNSWLRNGSYAVTFFILLSGFCMGGGIKIRL